MWDRGHRIVGGIDEVGRGPMAGPVTVAVVVLPERVRLKGIRDSKLLTPKLRHELAAQIRKQAIGIGLGWASHLEIDELGLTLAMKRAGQRALSQLSKQPDILILDGNHNYLGEDCLVETCIKADQSCVAVAAASIIAKVARDNYMKLVEQSYPGYGFADHKGYATSAHRQAIAKLGLTPYHRRRWISVQQLVSVNV